MPDSLNAGFILTHGGSKLVAWGPTVESAFEEALTGMLHAAGASLGVQPGAKSIAVHGEGASPAHALDELVAALANEHKDGQALDGSITMGGLVRSDTGWNGWASAGIDPEQTTPLAPFEFVCPPMLERKPGRVTIKAQLMVWDKQMLDAMEKLKTKIGLHPGGVFGPGPIAIDEP